MAFGDLVETAVDEKQGTSDTSLSITFAGAPSSGNLILVWIAAADGFSDPSGFTSIAGLALVDGVNEWKVYWKVAGGSESDTVTSTVDTSTSNRAMLGAVFEGPFDASPVDASAQDGTGETGSSSAECPTITATVASSLAVAFAWADGGNNNDSGRMNSPGDNGFTFGDAAISIASSQSNDIMFAHKTLSSAGAVGETRLQWIDVSTSAVAQVKHWGNQVNFKAGGGGDTTAPTYGTAPAVETTATTSVQVSATASDAVTSTVNHYAVLVTDGAGAPTPAEVVAGQASGGGAPIASDNETSVTNGVESILDFTGLSPNTAYDVYWVVTDGTNLSTATKVDVTTDATVSFTPSALMGVKMKHFLAS